MNAQEVRAFHVRERLRAITQVSNILGDPGQTVICYNCTKPIDLVNDEFAIVIDWHKRVLHKDCLQKLAVTVAKLGKDI